MPKEKGPVRRVRVADVPMGSSPPLSSRDIGGADSINMQSINPPPRMAAPAPYVAPSSGTPESREDNVAILQRIGARLGLRELEGTTPVMETLGNAAMRPIRKLGRSFRRRGPKRIGSGGRRTEVPWNEPISGDRRTEVPWDEPQSLRKPGRAKSLRQSIGHLGSERSIPAPPPPRPPPPPVRPKPLRPKPPKSSSGMVPEA